MLRLLKLLLVLAAIAVAVLVILGGGFGEKSNDALINGMDTVVFVHRAEHKGIPENTLEGVAMSHRLGYAGVELDLNVTKDGHLILFHDDSCQRLLGLGGRVQDHALSELRAVTLISHTLPTNARVNTLEEVLEDQGDSVLFYLDTKMTATPFADSLASMLQRHGLGRRALVASSSIPFLTHLEYHHPEINTVLEGFDKGEEWTWTVFPKKFRPDFVSSFAAEVDSAQVAWLKEHDLLDRKIVYGVDSASFRWLRDHGISRFILDAQ